MIATQPIYRWLPLAGGLGAIVVGLIVALYPPAGLALLGPIGLILLLVNGGAALPLLILAAALNRFGVQAGDAAIRLDYVVVLLLAVLLTNRLAVRTLVLRSLDSPLLLPVLAYAGLNVLSTVLFATEKVRGLKLDVEIVVCALTYIVVYALLRTRRDLEVAMKAIWIVTVGEAAIGLFFAAASVAHLTNYGVSGVALGLPAAFGTQWEPNIFGSYLLGNFFLLLADYFRGARSELHTLGLLVVILGIGASLTRTVWVGLVLCTLLFLALALRVRETRTSWVPLLAGVPIVALAGLVLGSATPFASRLTDVVNLGSTSAAGRFFLIQVAMQEWQSHPILGLGTGSFNYGAVPGAGHPWLPSLFALTVHDTGIAGAAALAWLILAFYTCALRAMRRGCALSFLIAGCIASVTSLLLAFQTTSGFWFTYPWIVFATGMASVRLNQEEGEDLRQPVIAAADPNKV